MYQDDIQLPRRGAKPHTEMSYTLNSRESKRV